jgi:hypothetical protein
VFNAVAVFQRPFAHFLLASSRQRLPIRQRAALGWRVRLAESWKISLSEAGTPLAFEYYERRVS